MNRASIRGLSSETEAYTESGMSCLRIRSFPDLETVWIMFEPMQRILLNIFYTSSYFALIHIRYTVSWVRFDFR